MSNATEATRQADALVLFGATGDLAHKKLFPALYAMVKARRPARPGNWHRPFQLGSPAAPRAGPRQHRPNARRHRRRARPRLALLAHIDGDYNDPCTFTTLNESLAGVRRPVFYLTIPPALSETVIEGLGRSSLADGGRVIVEKPFGRNLASAQEVNRVTRRCSLRTRSSASITSSARRRS